MARRRLSMAVLTLLALAACTTPAGTPQDATPTPDSLPPHLIEIRPGSGAAVRLGFGVCATFDVSDTGLGADWEGPVWLQVEGVDKDTGERRPGKAVRVLENLAQAGTCFDFLFPPDHYGAGFRVTVPPVRESPVDLVLQYQDTSGQEYRYAWQVEQPQATSPLGVTLSLDFEPSVRVGEELLIEIVQRNQRDVAVEYVHGFLQDQPVYVYTPNGNLVWRKKPVVGGDVGIHVKLEPGEEERSQTYWDLTDNDGKALPPGRYLLRGSETIVDSVEGHSRIMNLATNPYYLTIEP